ncbi:MAG TPA: ATP-binding protein [Alphaproteobacteria bacterium]|nr:ATP-binding protein [Alphaproteobacteria bacterium]
MPSARATDPWRPKSLTQAGFANWFAANIATAAFYFALAFVVSRFFAAYGLFPAPIWLPASVALVAAMVGSWGLLPGIFIGSFLANDILFAPPIYVTAIISLTNALGPVLGAAAIRRFRPPTGLFTRFSGVLAFLVGATMLSPAVSATGGAIAIAIQHHLAAPDIYSVWVGWWLTDSGGTLYLAPAVLLWLGVESAIDGPHRRFDRNDLLVWLGVAAGAVVLFSTPPLRGADIRVAFPFLLVVPLSWIALRMSLRSAYTLVSLVSIVACAGTVAGFGPFQDLEVANPLRMVGALVVLFATNVLTIVALFNERRTAEETSRIKSSLLASMSHDLRTPLGAIIGFADVMRNETWGPLGDKRYRDYVGHIHDSGRLLLDIINDILDLSKIEAGKRDIRPEMLDGGMVARACVQIVEAKAAEKRIAITVESDPEVRVYADDLALRQIMLNLLSNAIKFTPVEGQVTVRIVSDPAGGSAVEVADSGVGMDEAGIKIALEPYGQVIGGSALNDAGTGLGLPIAVRLVELHGGRLSIASAPGKGTRVRITFPLPKAV